MSYSNTAHDYKAHMQFWTFDAHSNFHERVEILSNYFPHCFLFCFKSDFAEMERHKGSWEEGSCAYKSIWTNIRSKEWCIHSNCNYSIFNSQHIRSDSVLKFPSFLNISNCTLSLKSVGTSLHTEICYGSIVTSCLVLGNEFRTYSL